MVVLEITDFKVHMKYSQSIYMYRSDKSNADAHMITTYVLIYSEISNIWTVRYPISQV